MGDQPKWKISNVTGKKKQLTSVAASSHKRKNNLPFSLFLASPSSKYDYDRFILTVSVMHSFSLLDTIAMTAFPLNRPKV